MCSRPSFASRRSPTRVAISRSGRGAPTPRGSGRRWRDRRRPLRARRRRSKTDRDKLHALWGTCRASCAGHMRMQARPPSRCGRKRRPRRRRRVRRPRVRSRGCPHDCGGDGGDRGGGAGPKRRLRARRADRNAEAVLHDDAMGTAGQAQRVLRLRRLLGQTAQRRARPAIEGTARQPPRASTSQALPRGARARDRFAVVAGCTGETRAWARPSGTSADPIGCRRRVADLQGGRSTTSTWPAVGPPAIPHETQDA